MNGKKDFIDLVELLQQLSYDDIFKALGCINDNCLEQINHLVQIEIKLRKEQAQ